MISLAIYGTSMLGSALLFVICMCIFMVRLKPAIEFCQDQECYKNPGWRKRRRNAIIEITLFGIVLLFIVLCPILFMEEPTYI